MDNEKRIELECDYCGVPISISDYRCPNCGANCTAKVKKYKEQQDKLREEESRRNAEYSQQLSADISKAFKAPFILIFASILIIAVPITMAIMINTSHRRSNALNTSYNANVGFNEVGEIENYSVKLDSYELYSYVSDNFASFYNTPEGYQKIAFHFIYHNKQKEKQYISSSMIHLKADGYQVEFADLKAGTSERVEYGKASYISILETYADSMDTIQGYIGFVVPKDAKKLKFAFGNVIITMDNPVYEETESEEVLEEDEK